MRRPDRVLPALLLCACGSDAAGHDANLRPLVLTTFYPTTYFAERIAGGLVEVDCPLPEGADPATWQPSRHDLARYQSVALVVVNGADFESWLRHVSLPQSRVVDCSASFADRFLRYASPVTHSHGGGGMHSHVGIDGHTWLDPRNAKDQAAAIWRAMSKTFPEHAGALAANHAALAADLDDLDRRFAELTPRLAGVQILTSHPAYGYIAQRYGWTLTDLDLDPAVVPDAAALATIRAARFLDQPAVMLWESPPTADASTLLAGELRIRSVVFRPAENPDAGRRAAGDDYLAIMRRNLADLAAALP